jgi:hypothetical protein
MTDNTNLTLCKTLTTLAQWTNNTIAKGYLTGLGILEETITDYTLNEVASLHSQNVFTKKFSKKQEGSESGADWLWCIGNPGEWLSILVQAKIVNPRTKQCHFLDYGTSHGKQSQLLLRYARKHKLLPLYCIYSFIDETTIPEAMSLDGLAHLKPIDWACSFIIPKYVQLLIRYNKKSQSDLLKFGIPWMLPFYKDENEIETNLAHTISHSLHKIHSEFKYRDEVSAANHFKLDSNDIVVKQKEHIRVQWASVDPTRLLTSNIPRIAVRLLTSRVKPTDSPISAISIISNTSINDVMKTEKAIPLANKDLPLFKGRKGREEDFWK